MAIPPTGLFAENSRGQDFLDRNVTATNFRGPPIAICFGSGEGFHLVDEVIAMAALFDAPLIAFTQVASTPAFDYYRAACAAVGYLYKSNRTGSPVFVSETTPSTPVTYGGPFIASAISAPNQLLAKQLAWSVAETVSRTTQNHPYLLGMMGVSAFTTDGNLSPPVYSITTALDVDALTKRWQGRAVTTTSQYQAVLDAAVSRPGLAALVNSALVPYIVLEDPI